MDCKEIQLVHSKGDQSWVFFGRNDAEAEIPVLWTPHAKSWLIGKDPDAGRDWGAGEEGDDRGWDSWMASPTWWMWVWVNSGSWWWTGRLWFMGFQRVGHDWVTELNWTEISSNINSYNLSQNWSERNGINISNCLSSHSIHLPCEVFDIAIIIALDLLHCGYLIIITIVLIISIIMLL